MAIILLIIVLVIAFALPITQKTSISIFSTFDNTVMQTMHLENWRNWYPAIKKSFANDSAGYHLTKDSSQNIYTIEAGGKKYTVVVLSPTSFQVSEVGSNWTDVFAFSVLPGDSSNEMQISIAKKNPLLFVLLNKNRAAENALNGLKAYLEDPKAFYGFEIDRAMIRDSAIASSNFKINKKGLFIKIHEAFSNLEQYVRRNGLEKAGHPSVSYNSIADDSFQITIGIPVNRPGPPEKEVTCLLLPAKGNVLVGYYEGRFSDRQKIYLAMSRYCTDHTLAAPAESFERYLNDSIPASDSSRIKIELNFPIY